MNKYATYSADQLEELFSRFPISVWSYSAVSAFSRNQLAFLKEYIYRERTLRSSTSVAGNAYHDALRLFFSNMQEGRRTSVVEMNAVGQQYVDNIHFEEWRLKKTTPSIESCIKDASESATRAITIFDREKGIYLDDIKDVISVEEKSEEWLTIYGVDIPLPCKSFQDLVIRTNDGKIVVIDHKLVSAYSDEREVAFVRGQQAVVYAKSIEAKLGIVVDEVWFMENKTSANKDGSPQIKKYIIPFDKDYRVLYEALLYEPLRVFLQSVADEDHVYYPNLSDKLVDQAEMFAFWSKTLVAEVSDFNIPESKKALMDKRQKKIRDASLASINPKVIARFRENASKFLTYDLTSRDDMTNAQKIEEALIYQNIPVKVPHEIKGYSSNTYLVDVSKGTKIASVKRYALDIARALGVPAVRIGESLVPYEGETYLSVEAPKTRTDDLLWNKKYLDGMRIPIGIDNYGKPVIWDLNNNSTPHMLICGATGSGKSVSIVSTIEYAKAAGVDDIVIFDPKDEFERFDADMAVRRFSDIDEIEIKMRDLVEEMQGRVTSGDKHKTLVIFDEFSDAINAAKSGVELDIREDVIVGYYAPKTIDGELVAGLPKIQNKVTGRYKTLEENLKILLQKGRSLGFRIVAATQRASVKVITGDAKVNFPVVVCFRVPREIDSKVVLDEPGAESLSGRGDGLMRSPEYMTTVRFQGFYKK